MHSWFYVIIIIAIVTNVIITMLLIIYIYIHIHMYTRAYVHIHIQPQAKPPKGRTWTTANLYTKPHRCWPGWLCPWGIPPHQSTC